MRERALWTYAKIAILVLISFNCFSVAHSQSIDLYGTVISGGWEPNKIAIGDFVVKGDSTSDAVALAAKIKRVISADLDFHIFFDTIPVNQFYVEVYEMTEITPLAWQRMGADFLVDGEVELDGDRVKVEYRIMDLKASGFTELNREKLKTKAQNYRRLAHMIADEVVKRITAEIPFFTTKIAFISAATGNKELYLCDYDGENVVRLTADKATNLSPAWDRKDDKVLFTSYKRSKQQIWEFEISSGKSRLISDYPISNNAVAVSPDNNELLVTLSKDGNAELYVLNRDGKMKRRLTKIPSIEVGASWSPTGREIAFQSDRSGVPQVYTMDSEGLNVQRLTFEGRYNDSPDFSPRGDAIVFVSRGYDGNFQICTVDIDGSNFTRLDQTGSNENPHFSPDGWHVVYCKRVGSKIDLFIMDRFKKRVKQITFDGLSSNPAWQPQTR